MILKYSIVILHYPRGKGKVPPLKELYEALIESIPAQVRVRAAIRGRWQSYAETEEGAGLASLLIPGKIPYTDTREYSRWIGRPLRDLAALIRGGEEEQSEAMGCAAINAWFNTRSRMAAELSSLGVSVISFTASAVTSSWMSMRSSSGPEMRERYREISLGLQRQGTCGLP